MGAFFQRLTQHASDRAKAEQDKLEESKKAEIGVWTKVLEDPDSSQEQRQKAAETLTKLYNWKGKADSPFMKLIGFFGGKGGGKGKDQQQPQNGSMPNYPQSPDLAGSSDKGGGGGTGATAGQAIGQGEKSQVPQPKTPPPQQQGQHPSRLRSLFDTGPKEKLPPLDANMFPTAETKRESMAKDEKARQEAIWPFEEKKIKLQEELRAMSAAAKYRNAAGSKTKYPGSALINGLPEASRNGLVDINGIPIDPNGLYGPANGESAGFISNEEGSRVLGVVRVGTGPAREGVSNQWVYDPNKNTFTLMPVPHSTKPPEPPKAKSGEGERPTLKLRGLNEGKEGGAKAATEKKPAGSTGKATAGKAGGGAKEKTPLIPIRAYGPLQKQANAINEARASLIGDTPGETAGLAGDIDIFKDPDSVKRVGQYINFVNKQLEESGRAATSMGPLAAVEWYVGLPGTISNLQQKLTSEYSSSLDDGAEDGPEHRFVADYYRLMGTWGGMRASTGASAAKWSFKNLISEMPTPGTVTSYPEARRRIINMARESNVVAKNSPMVKTIDVDAIFGRANTQDEVKQMEKELLK